MPTPNYVEIPGFRSMNDDCLYLNIATSSSAGYSVTNYAVLLWIYGGSFLYGDTRYNDPTEFVSTNTDIITD